MVEYLCQQVTDQGDDMKANTSGGLAKCERTDECTRDAVGTVRTPWYPVGFGDVPTCTEHAAGMVIWGFGKRSPYNTAKRGA